MCLASLTNVPEQLHEWNITSVEQVNWKAVLWNMETLHGLVSSARFNIVTQIHWSFYWFKLESKKGFKLWEKKQNNCDKSRECTLCKHLPTQVLMQPFQFLTLELWSPVAIGSKKQNDLRRVWQIQFDRFPHKTDFVFFLPMLCNQISSQDHNYQGVLSKNGDMDQYLRTDRMCGNWGSMRSCPFDKSCFFFHLRKQDKHCQRQNGPGGWVLSPK